MRVHRLSAPASLAAAAPLAAVPVAPRAAGAAPVAPRAADPAPVAPRAAGIALAAAPARVRRRWRVDLHE